MFDLMGHAQGLPTGRQSSGASHASIAKVYGARDRQSDTPSHAHPYTRHAYTRPLRRHAYATPLHARPALYTQISLDKCDPLVYFKHA